jgi:hypothetical protein
LNKKKIEEANLLDYQVDPIERLVHCNIFSFVLLTILLIFILLVREFGENDFKIRRKKYKNS